MIQLQVLSSRKADREIVVRHFPFVVGRGEVDLRLDDPGVWDRHLQIDFQPGAGFTCAACSEALVVVNGERIEQALLRNGDSIELGSARLRMWLARTEQSSPRWRESLTWAALVMLMAGEAALVYLLVR